MGWQKNTSKSVGQKVLTAYRNFVVLLADDAIFISDFSTVVKNEISVASILKVEGETI